MIEIDVRDLKNISNIADEHYARVAKLFDKLNGIEIDVRRLASESWSLFQQLQKLIDGKGL